jgi:hypothetical protein
MSLAAAVYLLVSLCELILLARFRHGTSHPSVTVKGLDSNTVEYQKSRLNSIQPLWKDEIRTSSLQNITQIQLSQYHGRLKRKYK